MALGDAMSTESAVARAVTGKQQYSQIQYSLQRHFRLRFSGVGPSFECDLKLQQFRSLYPRD